MNNILSQLTAPEPSERTRLILGCARAIVRNTGGKGSRTALRAHCIRATATAIVWQMDGAPDLMPKSFARFYGDMEETAGYIVSGLMR